MAEVAEGVGDSRYLVGVTLQAGADEKHALLLLAVEWPDIRTRCRRRFWLLHEADPSIHRQAVVGTSSQTRREFPMAPAISGVVVQNAPAITQSERIGMAGKTITRLRHDRVRVGRRVETVEFVREFSRSHRLV